MTYKKKLIEVALPLEAINAESAREKSIRHGHPSTLHLWWARRPLATCRAVLFASLVDDPDDPEANAAFVERCKKLEKGDNAKAHDTPRQRLFDFIEKLVKWENSNNEQILATARELINLACDGNPPPVLDPFCGGGSIPLEAQRLGLKAYASDLNPVAVLITKALIEIPPKFAGQPPVNPDWQRKGDHEKAAKLWRGAEGLAEDVRYYGKWMRDEAEKRIGQYYPKVKIPSGAGGSAGGADGPVRDSMSGTVAHPTKSAGTEARPTEATVIAWLWARTVQCPNPACGCRMPLVRSFELSKKEGKRAWAEPVIEPGNPPTIRFEVRTGKGTPPEGTVNRKGATCIACGTAVPFTHIRAEGKAGRMGAQLMAIVAEGDRGRIYLEPNDEHHKVAVEAQPDWQRVPDTDLPAKALGFRTQEYGMVKHKHLFTDRQLLALTTFSDLVGEARARVLADASAAGRPASQSGADDTTPLADGGTGAQAYADAVATYLAFAVDRSADAWSSLASWRQSVEATRSTFARQALPMVWDYTEANPFSGACGNFNDASLMWVVKAIQNVPASAEGEVIQCDATCGERKVGELVFSTDPPYYDNIGYADLSDFFYIWLKRSLCDVYPDLLRTMLVPKTPELVATPHRFGGNKEKAKEFFEIGLGQSFRFMRASQHPGCPFTVYYAFKQAEGEDDGPASSSIVSASTGWETMLQGLLHSGFQVTGTWPVRSERGGRMLAVGGGGTNALASSIVLVCRPRPDDAPVTTRRDLTRQLEAELPQALRELQDANIAPVDLAQAAIGPGMAVYSRYSKVLEASGEPMRVRDALVLINQLLYEHLNEGAEELDSETQFALAWFKQFQYAEGKYGEAEVLAKSKNIAVESLVGAGIAVSRAGKVRLLERGEYDHEHWDATEDSHLNAWEVTQRMIWALENKGEQRAAQILRAVGGLGETARELSYRLYTLCDQKGWAKEALAYNTLVQSWRDIEQRMRDIYGGPRQAGMDLGE